MQSRNNLNNKYIHIQKKTQAQMPTKLSVNNSYSTGYGHKRCQTVAIK